MGRLLRNPKMPAPRKFQKPTATRNMTAQRCGNGALLRDSWREPSCRNVHASTVRNVNGTTQVGSIGSGDFTLSGAKGDVHIESIGSGDAEVRDVSGNVSVGSLGSGDLNVREVRGDFQLEKKGSGSLNHSGITGNLSLPSKR